MNNGSYLDPVGETVLMEVCESKFKSYQNMHGHLIEIAKWE